LHAERTRFEMFASSELPTADGAVPAFSGTLNGKSFSSLADADPRIGPRLEVFAAGEYLWIPFAHLKSVRMEAPKRLRDTRWLPARVQTGAALRERDLGEVLLPVLCAQSYEHPDAEVRLGRQTEWCADESGQEAPYGLKQLLVDREEFPLLELRELEIATSSALVQ
jgi:type VI secretion system protein ImpE